METINFYSTRKKYGCFSNFSRHPVDLDGKIWPTSEHYYQSRKFLDPEMQEKVRLCVTAMDAANMGRDPNNLIREDWQDVKDDVMRKVVRAKFTQHEECKQELLSTGTDHIVEDSPIDWYWGCGVDRTGKNMLGVVLMEVREELRDA